MKGSTKGQGGKMCLLSWQDTLSAVNLYEWTCLDFLWRQLHSCTSEQRVLLIIFDRMQTVTNGIILSQTMYVADRQTGLRIWCLTVLKHGAYIMLYSTSIWKLLTFGTEHFHHWETRGKEPAAPRASRLRVRLQNVRRTHALLPPLINLQCPNRRSVVAALAQSRASHQHTLSHDFVPPPSAVMREPLTMTNDVWETPIVSTSNVLHISLKLTLQIDHVRSAELRAHMYWSWTVSVWMIYEMFRWTSNSSQLDSVWVRCLLCPREFDTPAALW